jgi:23S rRNA pseudouridine1911/1915/1917 synthase
VKAPAPAAQLGTDPAPAPPARFSVAVEGAERLDRFLADQLSLSRTVVARLIGEGLVTAAGAPARASLRPERGTEIVVSFPAAAPRQVRPAEIPLNVVFEDEELLVVDKPAGLVVHPAPGHRDDTLLNALVARGAGPAGGPEERPGIVHRLDKDTSGLLIVARTARSHERLGHALSSRRIRRRYAALAWGHPGSAPRRIEAWLARRADDRKRMTVVRSGGRHAVTVVRSIARGKAADLVRCELETGRTHQIRVHLQSIGHPVVGDHTYGGASASRGESTGAAAAELARAAPRQALHAAWLEFDHPITGERLDLRSEWPDDLHQALAKALGDGHLLAEPQPLHYLGFFAPGGPS